MDNLFWDVAIDVVMVVGFFEFSRYTEMGLKRISWINWTALTLMIAISYDYVRADPYRSISSEFRFLLEPRDVTAVRNKPAILDCTVESQTAGADIYWIKDGVAIQYDARRYRLDNGSLFFSTVEHLSSHRPDEGTYQCGAYVRTVGTIVSRKARLQVAYIRSFVHQPESQSVRPGGVAVFLCQAEAEPRPHISWYKDNQLMNSSGANHFVHANSALEIHDIRTSDFGQYQCRAWNEVGELFSRVVQLTQSGENVFHHVTLPDFLLAPPPLVDAVDGESVLLSCVARVRDESRATIQIVWLKDGVLLPVPRQSRWIVEGQGSLYIKNVTESDGGRYTCRALVGNRSSDVYTTVRVLVPPRFLRQPRSVAATANSDVFFECNVYAHPSAVIEWLKNGDIVVASDYFQVVDGRNLRILGVVESDGGMYQCTASNIAGMIQASAHLVVKESGTSFTSTRIPFVPEGLSVVTVTASWVKVAWQPSPLSTGSNLADGYRVTWKKEGSSREWSMNTTLLEAQIERLEPSTKYVVQVIAYNAHGSSKEVAELVTETMSETELELQAAAMSSTSVHLSWPSVVPRHKQMTLYKIYYSRIESTESDQTEGAVSENQATISDLLKFSSYRFEVIAYGTDGPIASSKPVVVRTLSDVPSSPPQNVVADAFSSTGIMIGWDPPPDDAQNGVIESYRIEYKQRKDRASQTVLVNGSKQSHEFTDLEKGSEYIFRLQALTVNGSGPMSAWVSRETLEHDLDEKRVPGKPTSLRVRPLSDSVMVSWTPPEEQDVRVRGYILGYGVGLPDIFRQILDARRRQHAIKGLKPSSEYVISLRAFNYAGEGVPIYETTLTRELTTPEPQVPLMPPIGVKTVVMSSMSVILSWSDTSRSHRISDGRFYTIRYNPRFQSRHRFINITELSVVIDDLRPDTEYEFNVKVSKGTRESTWSLSAFNRTREAAPSTSPRDLTIVPAGGLSALTLNWQPPRQANGQITGYLLYYSTDSTLPDSDWVVEGVLGDRLSTTVRDLTTDTTYYFKIQARNAAGLGPMSSATIFKTLKTDGTGKTGANTLEESDAWNNEPSGNDAVRLWIVIGCIAGSILVIVLVTIIAIICVFYSRHRITRKPSGGAASQKLKGSHRSLKPPDLWIHGNVELSELENIEGDDLREVEGATISRRRRQGGRDEEKYRSTSLRPVPLVIPIDTPPTYKEAGDYDSSMSYNNRLAGNSTFPSRSHYTPRVNVADITQSNPERELLSVSSSFKMTPPSRMMSSPHQACLPLLDHEGTEPTAEGMSDLPNYISADELTEEMANIEGLMRDLNVITNQHFPN